MYDGKSRGAALGGLRVWQLRGPVFQPLSLGDRGFFLVFCILGTSPRMRRARRGLVSLALTHVASWSGRGFLASMAHTGVLESGSCQAARSRAGRWHPPHPSDGPQAVGPLLPKQDLD